jgi:hypothetical protein
MGLDDRRLFVRRGFLLGLAQFLDQAHGLALQTALETSTCASMDEFDKVIIGHVEELFEFDATVGKGAERPLLLELSGESGVGNLCVSLVHDRPSSRREVEFREKAGKIVSDLGFKMGSGQYAPCFIIW